MRDSEHANDRGNPRPVWRRCRLRPGRGALRRGPRPGPAPYCSPCLDPVDQPGVSDAAPLAAPVVGTQPLLWRDWGRRAGRRAWMGWLRSQQVTITRLPSPPSAQSRGSPILSRAQRAHRRRSDRRRNQRVQPAGTALGALAPWWVRLLTDPRYQRAEKGVALLAFAGAVYAGYVVLAIGSGRARKTQWNWAVTGAGAAVNVGLNFWLVPAYGMIGAAVSTLVAGERRTSSRA